MSDPADRPGSHLVLAAVSCALFPPSGLVAVLLALQVDRRWSRGDRAGAELASRRARNVALWSIVTGIATVVLTVVLFVAAMALIAQLPDGAVSLDAVPAGGAPRRGA